MVYRRILNIVPVHYSRTLCIHSVHNINAAADGQTPQPSLLDPLSPLATSGLFSPMFASKLSLLCRTQVHDSVHQGSLRDLSVH